MRNVRFEVQTPLGFTVRTTDEYWERIVTEKHRNMRGCETDVKTTLIDPEVVRQSVADPNVLLFTDLPGVIGQWRSYADRTEEDS